MMKASTLLLLSLVARGLGDPRVVVPAANVTRDDSAHKMWARGSSGLRGRATTTIGSSAAPVDVNPPPQSTPPMWVLAGAVNSSAESTPPMWVLAGAVNSSAALSYSDGEEALVVRAAEEALVVRAANELENALVQSGMSALIRLLRFAGLSGQDGDRGGEDDAGDDAPAWFRDEPFARFRGQQAAARQGDGDGGMIVVGGGNGGSPDGGDDGPGVPGPPPSRSTWLDDYNFDRWLEVWRIQQDVWRMFVYHGWRIATPDGATDQTPLRLSGPPQHVEMDQGVERGRLGRSRGTIRRASRGTKTQHQSSKSSKSLLSEHPVVLASTKSGKSLISADADASVDRAASTKSGKSSSLFGFDVADQDTSASDGDGVLAEQLGGGGGQEPSQEQYLLGLTSPLFRDENEGVDEEWTSPLEQQPQEQQQQEEQQPAQATGRFFDDVSNGIFANVNSPFYLADQYVALGDALGRVRAVNDDGTYRVDLGDHGMRDGLRRDELVFGFGHDFDRASMFYTLDLQLSISRTTFRSVYISVWLDTLPVPPSRPLTAEEKAALFGGNRIHPFGRVENGFWTFDPPSIAHPENPRPFSRFLGDAGLAQLPVLRGQQQTEQQQPRGNKRALDAISDGNSQQPIGDSKFQRLAREAKRRQITPLHKGVARENAAPRERTRSPNDVQEVASLVGPSDGEAVECDHRLRFFGGCGASNPVKAAANKVIKSESAQLTPLMRVVREALLLVNNPEASSESFVEEANDMRLAIGAQIEAVDPRWNGRANVGDAIGRETLIALVKHWAPPKCLSYNDPNHPGSKIDRKNACIVPWLLTIPRSMHKEAGGDGTWDAKVHSRYIGERLVFVDVIPIIPFSKDAHMSDFRDFVDDAGISMAELHLIGFTLFTLHARAHDLQHNGPLTAAVATRAGWRDSFDPSAPDTATSANVLGMVAHGQCWAMRLPLMNALVHLDEDIRSYSSILLRLYSVLAQPDDSTFMPSPPEESRVAQRFGARMNEDLSPEERQARIEAMVEMLAEGRETQAAAWRAYDNDETMSDTQIKIVLKQYYGLQKGRDTIAAAWYAYGFGNPTPTQLSIVQRILQGGATGRETQAEEGHQNLARGRETLAAGGFEELARGLETQAAEGGTHDAKWDAKYARLKQFRATHGHTRVTRSDDKALYDWSRGQRRARKGTDRTLRMTDERIRKLDLLGFDWAPSLLSDRTTYIEDLVFEFCDDDEDVMREFLDGHTAGTLMEAFPRELNQYTRNDVNTSLGTIKRRLARKANKSDEG